MMAYTARPSCYSEVQPLHRRILDRSSQSPLRSAPSVVKRIEHSRKVVELAAAVTVQHPKHVRELLVVRRVL